jgi:hypothetical protein
VVSAAQLLTFLWHCAGNVQAITYNKQLREQIDNLRRERLMFEAINSNLDKELARIKRNIAGGTRRSNRCCTVPGQLQPTATPEQLLSNVMP